MIFILFSLRTDGTFYDFFSFIHRTCVKRKKKTGSI